MTHVHIKPCAPGSKDSNERKTFNHGVVDRVTGEPLGRNRNV